MVTNFTMIERWLQYSQLQSEFPSLPREVERDLLTPTLLVYSYCGVRNK